MSSSYLLIPYVKFSLKYCSSVPVIGMVYGMQEIHFLLGCRVLCIFFTPSFITSFPHSSCLWCVAQKSHFYIFTSCHKSENLFGAMEAWKFGEVQACSEEVLAAAHTSTSGSEPNPCFCKASSLFIFGFSVRVCHTSTLVHRSALGSRSSIVTRC